MTTRFTIVTIWISILFLSQGYAQFSPSIQNYNLAEYKAGNQNWDITRAEDGKVYVANNKGLLVYDALEWSFYQLPNKTIVRSVLTYNDLVFTGSYEEFGYWEKDDYGLLSYHSLSEKVLGQMSQNEEIWQIVRLQDKIIFRSFLNIYIYDFETVTQVRPKSAIISCNVVEGQLYVCTLNNGIFLWKQGNLIPFYNHPVLKNTKIIGVVKHKEKLLILTSLNGSYYLTDGNLVPAGFKIEEQLKLHQLNKFSLLPNGNMVFGTIKDGVFITDGSGNLKFHISKENGLLNNTVLGQHIDASNNLWLGLDNGNAKIDLDSQHYFFNDISGKLGAVYDVIKYKENIYIGSNTGLFKLDGDGKLVFIEGSQGQVWDLQIIDGELFCGHNDGTFLVEDEKIKMISDFTGGWTITKVPERPNTYIQGTYTGLVKFEKIKGQWHTKHLGKTTIPSRFLVFENPRTAWVAHAYKGLYRVKFDTHYDTVTTFKTYDDKGISSNFNVRVYNLKNIISFKTNNGWRKYEPIIDSIVPYKLLNEKFGKDAAVISENNVDQLVLMNTDGVLSFRTFDDIGKVNTTLGSNSIKDRYIVGYENVSKIKDSIFALNLVNGFMMIDSRYKKAIELHQPTIESLYIDNEPVEVASVADGFISMDYGENLKVDITSPKSSDHFFEYRIAAINNKWYKIDNGTVELTKIKEGEYKIEFRAQNDFGITSPIRQLKIEIFPPWYRGLLGFVLYAFLAILLIALFFYMHKRKIAKEQRLIKLKLQKEQQKLLREKTLENEKRIVQLKNEALQSDIKLKSKQLANNAMALVKKNESLQEIKKELMTNKDTFDNYYAYKKLLKKVDNSIVLKDEWEVFEHNFNQVHDEFFQKLKQKHHKLTSKDLKVCAYIKMNLSSKEIAPLMNISVRGVETHRYRLKKKLNLENDTSVVDYLLNLQ